MDPSIQTLLMAIVGGVAAQWISQLIRLPAIIPLLLFGILLGPEGIGWIPKPSQMIPFSLHAIVSIGVAVILFEGGLSLNLKDIRLAPQAVRNLLSIGAVVTCAGATLAARYLAGLEWSIAALYGSLMIVTGPTVIVPLLKNVRVTKRVHTVLLWEGILIDAIGAITAVVMLDLVILEQGFFWAGSGFVGALIAGPLIGAGGGWLLSQWLRWRKGRGVADEEMDSLLALGGALAIYGLSETWFHEAGLGAVTCAGLVMTNMLGHDVERFRRFKGTLTTLLVSVLFMLLAANFELDDLEPLWPMGYLAIAAVMFLVRPASVFLCSWGSTLTWRERVFIGLTAPRGIVAASVASLFAFLMQQTAQERFMSGAVQDPAAYEAMVNSASTLVALTFSTIMVTVVVNGLGTLPLAWFLGLRIARPEGLLIVGASELSLRVAGIFENRGIPVLMIDTNPDLCERARQAGFQVAEGSALDGAFLSEQDFSGLGRLLALTSSTAVNVRAAANTAKDFNLAPAVAVVTKSASPEEIRMLEQTGGGIAFGMILDVGAMNSLLRLGAGHVRSHKAGKGGAIEATEKAFLPVALERAGSLVPYGTDKPQEGEEVIGLEFDRSLSDEVPFEEMKESALSAT